MSFWVIVMKVSIAWIREFSFRDPSFAVFINHMWPPHDEAASPSSLQTCRSPPFHPLISRIAVVLSSLSDVPWNVYV